MAKFDLDPDHTAAEFDVRHMMVTWVHGKFTRVTGVLYYDPTNVSASSVEAEIDVTSILTGVEARDNDLRSPNYFDAEKFPRITFKSTGVDKDWQGSLTGLTRR